MHCLRASWRRLTSIMVTLLCCLRTVKAQRQCSTVSDVGPVVQLGSSFKVYCTFHKESKDKCRKSIHMDKKEIYNTTVFNSTTIFVNINKITENRTYTCKCGCCTELCGFDITVGYPPDVPENLSCIQTAESGNVMCTWKTGRKTYIGTVSRLWVKAQSHDDAQKPVSFPGSNSATFPIFGTQSNYSVWVNVSNTLGTAISPRLNFTLNDIVKPLPLNTVQVNCSARLCILYWTSNTSLQLLQVKHRCHQGSWTTHPITDSANKKVSIPDLEPFTVYEFQVRWKLSADRGLWSEWGHSKISKTDEEAPRKSLDIWFIEKPFTVLWKELSQSEANGKILGYKLTVQDFTKRTLKEYRTNSSSGWLVTCSSCNITVSAYNSKGHSPPAFITILNQKAQPPLNVVCVPVSNHTIAISWQRPATTRVVKGYLVEWFPTHLHRNSLQWKRLSPDQLQINITENIQPFQCYQGAVYALYEQGWGREDFTEAYSGQSVPTVGPMPTVKILADSVTVNWSGIPQESLRGCLKSYSIYLRRTGEKVKKYGPIDASQRQYTIRGLQSGEYYLFMTGSTAEGEGRRGASVTFVYIQHDESMGTSVIVMVLLALFALMVFIYLCNASSIWRRISACLCIMPDSVPDPANSKWAKECTTAKGEMTLEFYLNDSTLSEEEPHTMEIEELQETLSNCEESFRMLASSEDMNRLATGETRGRAGSQDQEPYPGQPVCHYIKSFSQESSPDHTESSKSIRTTVDYISSNGLMDCEEPEDCPMTEFFPTLQSPFLEPMVSVGGKLTLDAVKIDCSEIW